MIPVRRHFTLKPPNLFFSFPSQKTWQIKVGHIFPSAKRQIFLQWISFSLSLSCAFLLPFVLVFGSCLIIHQTNKQHKHTNNNKIHVFQFIIIFHVLFFSFLTLLLLPPYKNFYSLLFILTIDCLFFFYVFAAAAVVFAKKHQQQQQNRRLVSSPCVL